MVDFAKLSPPAIKAAMKGGTTAWGRVGSVDHVRYSEKNAKGEPRRKCPCGCRKMSTHRGVANGVTLMIGCEFYVARWVKDWRSVYRPHTPSSEV